MKTFILALFGLVLTALPSRAQDEPKTDTQPIIIINQVQPQPFFYFFYYQPPIVVLQPRLPYGYPAYARPNYLWRSPYYRSPISPLAYPRMR